MAINLSGTQYRPLTQVQVETIHEAALTILEKTGIGYEAGLTTTIDLLGKAGARVNHSDRRVILPRELVHNAVGSAPSRVVLYSRDGMNDLDLCDHRVHLGTGGAAVRVLDLETGRARSPMLRDIYDIGRLVDKLNNINFFHRPCLPSDIPVEACDTNVIYACLKATAKPVMVGVADIPGLNQMVDIAAMVAGGKDALKAKPFVSVSSASSISPLKLCTQSTLINQECMRLGIPVALSSAPMSGSTAPMTMAGVLTQLHAEELAGITICQLTKPGGQLLYGGIPGRANMNTMGYMGGAIECGMMNAAIHQLAHHIRVPNYNSAGITDAKIPDIQAGWEKAFTTLLAAMGGSNFIHHAAGMLESLMAVAYEQYVLDDEIIGAACKALEGICVDPEHLALEVIDSIGPGGNFMTAPHTMDHMRQEYFMGNGVSDCGSREKWERNGSGDARTRARSMVKKILSAEPCDYIPEEIDRAVRRTYEIFL